GVRRQAVLAVLALHVGEVVSVDHLVEVVWGGRAPSMAVNAIQRHVSYLRSVLGTKDAILARSPGYLLDLGDEGTDLQRAERLVGQSRQSDDPAARAELLSAALALWRGRPLAEIGGSAWLDDQAR